MLDAFWTQFDVKPPKTPHILVVWEICKGVLTNEGFMRLENPTSDKGRSALWSLDCAFVVHIYHVDVGQTPQVHTQCEPFKKLQ